MMEVKDRIILDLCGGTGAWSRPYKEAGYDVRNITLPYYDVRTYEPPDGVYGILAAPPCNEFSLAKGSQYRNFPKGLEIVDACHRIIRQCVLGRNLAFWCLENPRGFLRQFMGKSAYTIRYWWYGDGLDKPTDLWGYFTLPKRLYKEPPILLKKIKYTPGGTDEKRQITRAKTPPGFAQAFFEANQ